MIEIQPGRIFFAEQLARRAGLRIDREQRLFLLRAILHDEAKRRGGLLPDDAREIRIFLAVPFHPPRRAAGTRDNSEPDLRVVRAGARIKVFRGQCLRMKRVGDETDLDPAVVHFFVGDPLRIGRPPESFVPIHFLLRDKLGQAVLQRLGRTRRDSNIRLRLKIDHVQLAAADRSNGAAIRRKMWIEPTASRQFRNA